jgi:hypothetical protein
MDDPLLVRGCKSLRELLSDGECFVDWDGPLGDPIGEGRSLDQFHHERADAVRLFQAVDVRDVGVIERRQQFRLALEAR